MSVMPTSKDVTDAQGIANSISFARERNLFQRMVKWLGAIIEELSAQRDSFSTIDQRLEFLEGRIALLERGGTNEELQRLMQEADEEEEDDAEDDEL